MAVEVLFPDGGLGAFGLFARQHRGDCNGNVLLPQGRAVSMIPGLVPGEGGRSRRRYLVERKEHVSGQMKADQEKRAVSSPAVFLDRDGTIIEDRGDLSEPAQVVFFSDTVSSLRRLAGRFTLFVVTNQGGVGKGAITMQDVDRVNAHVLSHLQRHGIRVAATYVCPHERASGCRCIKPNPYFLRKAERDFGIDLARSFVIGDHPHDVEFAVRGGATGIYVLSGHGRKHRADLPARVVVTDGIREATDLVLRRAGRADKQAQNGAAS